MKLKEKIYTTILCVIVLLLYITINSYNNLANSVNKVFNVYLDGKLIGAISDKDALYNLIDSKQQDIKDKYNVENVYPPKGLQIIEDYSYDTDITDLETIYNKIEDMQDFTISGYEVRVTKTDENKDFSIYILDIGIC